MSTEQPSSSPPPAPGNTPAPAPARQDADSPLLFDLRTQLGGPRGIFDATTPAVVLAIAAVVTTLPRAIVAALVTAALLAGFRALRREPVRQVAMSLGGIAFGALLARATGDAKTFFLPGILMNGGYALAAVVSIAVRRPLLGYVAAMLDSRYGHWLAHPPLRRAAARATWVWFGVFAARFVGVGGLYLADREDLLPLSRLLLGLPLYLVAIGISVWLLRPHGRVDDDEAAAPPATSP